jgi:hypothetical protein
VSSKLDVLERTAFGSLAQGLTMLAADDAVDALIS